jgi:hypothetical protein
VRRSWRRRCTGPRRWQRRSPAALAARSWRWWTAQWGAVWAPGGRPRAVFRFTVSDGKIAGIDVVVDPERVLGLEVVVLAE